MVIRYNFHIENFTRYPVTRTVDIDLLENSLYIMKACLVMYTGLRQLRLFTTPIRLLIDPYYKIPATTSLLTHPYIFCYSSNSFPILENNCAVAVALLRCMR